MELKRISKKEFDLFYSLMEKDFPYKERKSKGDELIAFDNPYFKPYFIYHNKHKIGYFCYWDFKDFLFGEHFAILEDLRNIGLGTMFLKSITSKIDKPLIIEVERPDTIIAERRINFYKRLGFVVNNFDYMQPSYHGDEEGVPMLLLSYGNKLSQEDYDRYIPLIRKEVYNLE